MEFHTVVIFSSVFIGPVSTECTSSHMCKYSNVSLENMQTQSVKKEDLFPKSCAAACVDRKTVNLFLGPIEYWMNLIQ